MSNGQTNQLMDWLESRRFRAWNLHQQGWSQARIAEELGVSPGAVSQWFKRVRDHGSVDALRRSRASGQRAKLTKEQFIQLPDLLTYGAESFGFCGNKWTTRRVAAVIKQVFGVSYHPGHVSRILQQHCPNWRNIKKP
jgi:transposase